MGQSLQTSSQCVKDHVDLLRAPPESKHQIRGTWTRIGKASPKDQYEWLDAKRKFFVWENKQNVFAHSSLGFQYMSKVESQNDTLNDASRFLKVEIFHTGAAGEVYLQYTGVLKKNGEPLELQDYTKCPQFILNASIQELQTACEREHKDFGTYNYITNNCQTFTSNVLKHLQDRFKEDIQIKPSASVMESRDPEQVEAAARAEAEFKEAWKEAMATKASDKGTAATARKEDHVAVLWELIQRKRREFDEKKAAGKLTADQLQQATKEIAELEGLPVEIVGSKVQREWFKEELVRRHKELEASGLTERERQRISEAIGDLQMMLR
jgi:hypothetical protein